MHHAVSEPGPRHDRVLQAEQRHQSQVDQEGKRRRLQVIAAINCRKGPTRHYLPGLGQENDETQPEAPHDCHPRPRIGEGEGWPVVRYGCKRSHRFGNGAMAAAVPARPE